MARDLFESLILAIGGSFTSVLLVRFGGEIIDRVIEGFVNVGLYEVGPEWQTDPSGLINLFYIAAMLPAVIGILLGILRSQQTTEAEVGAGFDEEFEVREFR